MIITRFGTAFYVRTSWPVGGYDKVLRLGLVPTPVDVYGERLIPRTTLPANTISAYMRSTEILRAGSDESPPAHIDGQWRGANHPAVAGYVRRVKVDGKPPSSAKDVWTGKVFEVVETYYIPTEAQLIKKFAPHRAHVTMEWRFGTDGFCRFKYTLVALKPMVLDYINGMQAQKPVTKVGQTLSLIVPGSNLANGVDITTEAQQRLLPVSDWNNPALQPHIYIQEVRTGGVPQWAFMMGFDTGVARGNLTTAFERSAAKKFYPRGYEGPDALAYGNRRTVSGFFGSYNRL